MYLNLNSPKKQTQTNPVLLALRSLSEGWSLCPRCAAEWANFKSEVRGQMSVFCLRSSFLFFLSSVFCPLFSDEAQIIDFSRQKKFDSLAKFSKILFFV